MESLSSLTFNDLPIIPQFFHLTITSLFAREETLTQILPFFSFYFHLDIIILLENTKKRYTAITVLQFQFSYLHAYICVSCNYSIQIYAICNRICVVATLSEKSKRKLSPFAQSSFIAIIITISRDEKFRDLLLAFEVYKVVR